MKLHDPVREIPFESKIDAAFPYEDPPAASALIKHASAISLNAVFCVLDEISRCPDSKMVSIDRQIELLNEWSGAFDHPLKAPLTRCATALITGSKLNWSEAVEIMEKVAAFEGQRAALSVAYFSGDSESDEGDAALNATHQRITDVWDSQEI